MSDKPRHLVLVERFDELVAGMEVVVMGCVWCGSTHQGGLLRLVGDDLLAWPDGSYEIASYWKTTIPSHRTGSTGSVAVTSNVISQRRVFRFVYGAQDEDAAAYAEKPTVTRERKKVTP